MTPLRRLTVPAACFALAAATLPLAAQLTIVDAPPTSTTAPAALTWQTSLEPALAEARQNDRPVILIFGAPWCPWCQKLSHEIETPEVQAKLIGMTRVYLDFDKNREAARRYAVGPIPALRILRSNGRVQSVQDGYMRAERLVAWLDESQQAAAGAKLDAVLAADTPTEQSIAQAVAVFANPEPEAREAAIRRLLPWPAEAAPSVAKAFATGTLAVRLTALDLLDSWKAPIDKLDPWHPETITPERLNAITQWAQNPTAAAAAATQRVLDDRQLADARQLIDRLLAADDPEAATALRERLARFGPPLLPTVYAALKNPSSEKAKERLTVLRYRLACSDALALQWPVGLEHLASPQINLRHAALDDLSQRATAKDAPLLLELFSDPDPLVRETSLRLLQKVGGPSATDALAGLLKDPDSNVRAAVLKSVEEQEQPSPAIANQVAAYVAQEKDPDLLVHAARVLRKSKVTGAAGDTSLKALYTLLDHESWRVRAEAAEALTEMVTTGGGGSGVPAKILADFYVRMSGLLDDPDGFVASKAMLALEKADALPDPAKVAQAAQRHPELAAQAVKMLAKNQSTNPASLALIQSFATHKDPAVRAITVIELTGAVGERAAGNIQAALNETDPRLHIAAATAIFNHLGTLYPNTDSYRYSSNATPPNIDKFLADFDSGKTRPAWLNAFRPDLEKSLDSANLEERVKAAQCLVAYGDKQKALPVLTAVVEKNPAFVDAATYVLQWLPWQDRLAFFNTLLKNDGDHLNSLANAIATGDDPRAAESLWILLAQPKANWSLASSVSSDLRYALGLEHQRYLPNNGQPDPKHTKELVDPLLKILDEGNEMQRVVALALIHPISATAAADAAAKLHDDEKASPELRRDAFQIQLAILQPAAAQSAAAAALTGKSPLEKQLAMNFLVEGSDGIRELRDAIYLSLTYSSDSYPNGQPITPVAPHGVTVEMLTPMLNDPDKNIAVGAAYLLALLHDRSGINQLIAWYKTSPTQRNARRMVYRAIAALDDDSLTPSLTDIYKSFETDSWSLREFYWTIRVMTGEKCMALRKQIRAEVGMEKLR